MTRFIYSGITDDKQIKEGNVEASNHLEAIKILVMNGIKPIKLAQMNKQQEEVERKIENYKACIKLLETHNESDKLLNSLKREVIFNNKQRNYDYIYLMVIIIILLLLYFIKA